MKKTCALAFVLAAVLLLGGGAGTQAANTQPDEEQLTVAQEKSEKQKAFEKELAQKKAEFAKRYNEVEKRNSENRRRFDEL